ncbi:Ku DNA-binding complex, Ku70 subunit [Ascodesmis nigricans]|uniref:ATP-dependent DNA helicase II subunit 1 n=1 Tax=Ascodesmis nigricans TaxID=341454 RepID=A0A4S2N483_9PEZI|nr:Ku DNA-binding complex, Ku70 subunit [Ascodesmis nigricans]
MSSQNKWAPDDDRIEEEEDEEDLSKYQNQKDAVLFAIHVSSSMLSVPENDADDMDIGSKRKSKKKENQSAVRMALECSNSILQSRIISSPNDMMGILLFGTDKTKAAPGIGGSGGFSHCYSLMELDVPDADGIKQLKALLEDEESYNDILVPSSEQVSMANVLFCANQIFTIKCPNFASRKLFIITDDDDPHATDKALKNSAITRARDLYDLGVIIDPFYISYPGKPGFDPSKFYDDIVYRSPYDDDNDMDPNTSALSGAQRLKEMRTTMLSKSTPKRALFSTKLEIAPGLTIGVKGYLMFKKQEKSRSHYVYTGGEKAQIVEGTTIQLAEYTAQVVEKEEIKKAYKFGGEHIIFTDEEMKEMRRFGEPVIRILGFKPASSLPFDHNVKPASFIYPDEQDFVGSTRTFTALHNKLYNDDKIAIAWAVTRKNAPPVLVALLSSLHDPSEPLPMPSGFFMVQLPFADDIRKNPDVTYNPAPKDLVDAMREIVKQLHIATGYQIEKYENPSLQWHYRILQALALDEDLPDTPIDKTLPKYRLIDKHTGDKVRRWADVFEKYASGMRVKAVKEVKGKRMADIEGGRGSSKKGPAVSGDEAVIQAYRSGTMNKLTVAALKEYLASNGLTATGKKQQLIDATEEFLDAKGF